MAIDLSPENEKFIADKVAQGMYGSREEALDAGVELLRTHDQLVIRLTESRRQLDVGEYTDYDDESLAARFDNLKRRVRSQVGE
jgi:Arc/MetJ-type ribon-helix-helix transcriptional regulator